MTEILTFHADPLIFHAASEVVKGWGYDMEEAVNLFLRRFVETVPLPEHPVPREEAVATIRKTVDRNCMDMYTQPLLLPHGDNHVNSSSAAIVEQTLKTIPRRFGAGFVLVGVHTGI